MDWTAVVTIALFLICLIGGLMIRGFIEDQKLASRPYVDEKYVDGKRYTDDRAADVLRQSFEHSDMNRKDISLKMEQMTSDYRSSQATFTAKIDSLIDTIKNLRDDFRISQRAKVREH